MAYTGNTDLAILLNKDTFEPDPIVLTFKVDSTSKGTWGMVLLIVRGLLRRPSLSGSSTVTFCSVHIHNVVAKKRDASTELLQRLHGYMREQNVDFIGGDFNMSAFSMVGDVFTDDEFSAPGNSLPWGLGALEEPNRECDGFLIMPKRPYEWRVHSHGCLAWDHETNLLILQCSFIFVIPICQDPAASCVVSKHNKDDLSADTTKNVCRDDVHECTPVNQGFTNMTIREENVHDRDPVRQGHVSAFPFTPFAIASESFASQLCLPTALTHGRFASSLCLCLFVSLSLCLCVFVSLSLPSSISLSSVSVGLQLMTGGCPHVQGHRRDRAPGLGLQRSKGPNPA